MPLNGVDSARRYSEFLRSCLNAKGGVAPGQRVRYDTGASVRLPWAERQPASLRH